MASRITTIGELAACGALQFGDGYRTKRSEHGQEGYRIVRVADVTDDGVSFTGPDFVSEEYSKAIGPKVGQPGDILLTTKGTVGRIAVLPETRDRVVYSPQLCFFRILNSGVVAPRFLRHWFSSPEFWSQAADRMNNTDMAAYINLADIRSLKLTLPEIPEQRAIAEVLGALDDKIAANTKRVVIADKLARSLTRRAMDAARTITLSSLATVTMGSSPAGTSFNETGDGTVFYQGVRDFGVRFPTNRVWTTSPVRMALPGDTLLSVRAPVGRVNLATEETCIGRGVASIRSSTRQPFTLFHILKDSPDTWAPFEAEGTVFGSINRGQLESLTIPTVREEDERYLESSLASLEAAISTALQENATLATTRDALLPQLMSGKLRVKDAKKLVSAAV
ncbi:restriction endonuclease subunit S [Paenarthrobacter sp. PH39-S1]|uniref:restriction endonuclease subunit S n=1 Tax=Paenarthrobacter sp. PH39-S1 TaxID=3046204 RepID=UPI0024B8A307|nr:restriction endonuclease subunit S [Paenarthrobacter sp. PH39-S1]MDJ0355594.1 restriction endonuclease subunit S [Paenarthrobacter sp. PH39-S1]